jgi:hypothetical protein
MPDETWDGTGIAGMLVKTEDERRYTLCLAYPVNRPDAAIAADGYRDFAGRDAVREAAHNYIRKSRKVGAWHADGTDGAGEVVESYLAPYDGAMTAVDGSKQIIKEGDWMLGIIWEPDTWALIKQGLITGVSMQGSAVRRVPSAETVANLRSA